MHGNIEVDALYYFVVDAVGKCREVCHWQLCDDQDGWWGKCCKVG